MPRLGQGRLRAPVRESTSLAAVDAALAMASRGDLMTAEEAASLLRGVQAVVEGGGPEARIAGIVTTATNAYSGQRMLERSQVVDPLLDIRLAMCD